MSQKDSIFGAEPDRLRQLVRSGMDIEDENGDVEDNHPVSGRVGGLMEQPGIRIGCYKLLRVLGEGGMGIVYLAEQEQPIKRQVALKVIKPGMDSKRVIARFEAERQALALLDYPNIAHVYDAGTTEAGRPYFVMEYIKGTPITEYCDHYKLSIKDRLRLFKQVCQAVQHAHQKGIIHRDIKPSNILVTTHEDQAVPKIIDFGVAKAVSQSLTERTLFTEQGQLFGTPEYMSPEQADMASEDIDTRSDIYSLGVLLYVLLTGVLPFDPDTLREGGIEHIRQVIRETDPKTPSTRLTKLGDEGIAIAKNRQMEIQKLARQLRKELEWIPLKAMRKERTERYRSASEFAYDIENYINGDPLIAGPLSKIYRLKKFTSRNRTLVAGTLAVLVVSVIGAVVSLIFAIGQAHARAESQSIADFLTNDVLASVSKVIGRDATAADILGLASESLEGRFKDQPLVEADICWRLGRTYTKLGDHRAAIPHMVRSYQLRKEQFGEHRNPTIYTKNYLALAYLNAGQYSEAELLFDELIKASDPENVRELPGYKCNLACVYIGQGHYEEAERILVEALSSESAWWEWWSPQGRPYLNQLAEMYLYQGRYKEAEQLFEEALEQQEGQERFDNLSVVPHSMSGLGRLCVVREHYVEAEEFFTKGMEIGRRVLPGKNHPDILRNINGLAVLRSKQKQYEDAERLFQEVLEARKIKLGDVHPSTLKSKNDLAVLYKEQTRYEEAEPLLLEAVEGQRLKLGDNHQHTLESWHNLIELYEAWNKPEKAEEWRAKLLQTEAVDE
jgi:serine/threonine protein kinase